MADFEPNSSLISLPTSSKSSMIGYLNETENPSLFLNSSSTVAATHANSIDEDEASAMILITSVETSSCESMRLLSGSFTAETLLDICDDGYAVDSPPRWPSMMLS